MPATNANDPNGAIGPNGSTGAVNAPAAIDDRGAGDMGAVDGLDAAAVWQATVWTEALEHTIGQQLSATHHDIGDAAVSGSESAFGPSAHRDPGNLVAARRLLDALRAAGYVVVPDCAVAVELVVTDDVAARLGLTCAQVSDLYRRGLLPPAVGRVGGDRHVWRAHLIDALLTSVADRQVHAQAAADAAAARRRQLVTQRPGTRTGPGCDSDSHSGLASSDRYASSQLAAGGS